MLDPITVFISSTCYDLVDLRLELSAYLTGRGFRVRLSEDPTSAFYVDPTVDSIESCLLNVDHSDVVVCVVDREYGTPLPDKYDLLSATHCEVKRARESEIPVLFFVRDAAWSEFHQLKRDPDSRVQWVEKNRPDRRKKWVDFVGWASGLPAAKEWSNWFNPFHSVVDLKDTVESRLLACFPTHAASLALQPGRLVRLHFVPASSGEFRRSVNGHFRNSTENSAFNVAHGWRVDDTDTIAGTRGALAYKENVSEGGKAETEYAMSSQTGSSYGAVFCEYDNPFGDRYRVEVQVQMREEEVPAPQISTNSSTAPVRRAKVKERFFQLQSERFFVRSGPRNSPEWIEVSKRQSIRPESLPPVLHNAEQDDVDGERE